MDAIVNPTNRNLTMDEGLAGIIKKKGGAAIEEEAMSKVPLMEGEAVETQAGKLKAKNVIHAVTVGPMKETNQDIIRKAVKSSLECAARLKVQSMAFPALGTGVGGFPLVGSGKIMVQEIIKFLRNADHHLQQVTFCLYDTESYKEFNDSMRKYMHHLVEILGPGPYVTVDIIIELPHGIILIERSNPPYGWSLPGGFLDYGENLERAAIREAKEETNLDLINLRQFHTYSNPNRDPRFHTISTVFIAQGRGTAQSGSDAKDLKVVRYEDLPQLEYAFDHKDIIKEYLMEREFGDDRF